MVSLLVRPVSVETVRLVQAFETPADVLGTVSLPVGMSISVSISNTICCFGSRFLVRLEVEVDEKPQVACKQAAAHQCSTLLACTVTEVRKVWIIGVGIMFVSWYL